MGSEFTLLSPCFRATPPSSIQTSSRLHSAKDLRANQSDPAQQIERIHETHRATEQGIEAAFPRRRPPKEKIKTEVSKMPRPNCRGSSRGIVALYASYGDVETANSLQYLAKISIVCLVVELPLSRCDEAERANSCVAATLTIAIGID
jgi:hypothetical protein